jgi:hypothetical protein
MKNQITYTEHNGLYYPNLALPEQTNYTLGKYANLRLAQERGIDEALNAHSPLQWTAEMNNI